MPEHEPDSDSSPQLAAAKAQPPERSILEVFPNEIMIAILERMEDKDLRNFSQCSVRCHRLSFLGKMDLVLTPESIARFQDGGICADLREFIHSVRFEHPDIWLRNASQIEARSTLKLYPTYGLSNDALLSKIRTSTKALGLFPNIQELFISYKAPWESQMTVYLAILRGMIGHLFCNTLRRLEIQIMERRAYICTGCPAHMRWNESLSFNDLSPENEGFIKGQEDHNTADSLIDEFVPWLPALTEARILADHLPMPYGELANKESALYYTFLARAPNVRKLKLETQNFQRNDRELRFDVEFLQDIFLQIRDLRITTDHINQRDIAGLVDKFRHLQFLDFQVFEGPRRVELGTRDYNLFSSFKELEYIRLPWACSPNHDVSQPVPPSALKTWVNDLLNSGLGHLQMVELLRSTSASAYEALRTEGLSFTVERTGKTFKIIEKSTKQ
ncbi:hypothetical protein TWF481_002104 [Arthrobotrys musiformis]|uniref:F-box domain-containing protein n=1 Tax=Arthrobotrys musiformis TaxID=47236 RepID=A0AAV9VSD7_9PEZI